MSSEKGGKREKNQNIQVFVRLRPLNQRERDIKSLGVVEVANGREVVVRQSQQSMHTKRFTFDRAFPPHSKQVEVYQEVVSPLIEEVLAGYNCTVFAYGQTGTGKTHTMVGEAANDETTWQSDPLAGIIPRALSQLFDELRISNTEYTVRVSYLELYNEELFDLLSTSEDNSKLRIYEDVTRKGANIVNGLEEITVYNKTEVYKIMSQGQERKRVASTLMNAQSSRSHTVFTIVVHMKENSPEGEELVKIGKLNLVDLAGSENISKAGSDNPAKRERARECVNINQSLLTLGRVITALVERHPHIPYRESKLTRILQESLGGRTKTSIIATISPGHKDLEETMSTLEYANRAKNIQNKPEINQKMTKKAILKEYAEEIDKLKRDLYAAREKNGVYLANETFAEMTLKQEEQRKEIQELLLKKRSMEEEKERFENVFQEMTNSLEEHKQKLNLTVDKLCSTENMLANTNNILKSTKLQCDEQRYLVNAQAETENALTSQAKLLLEVADAASSDACKLLDTVCKRRSVESSNLEITRTYREVSSQHRARLTTAADNHVGALTQALEDVQTALDLYTNDSTQMQTQTKQILDALVQQAVDTMNKMTTLKNSLQNDMNTNAHTKYGQYNNAIEDKSKNLQNILERFANCVTMCLQRAGQVDLTSNMKEFLQEWQTSTTSSLTRLNEVGAALQHDMRARTHELCRAATRQRDDRLRACAALARDVEAALASIQIEKNDAETCLSEQINSIEEEKSQFENRLHQWAEEERKLLEERIKRHIDCEKRNLDQNIALRHKNIEQQRQLLGDRTVKNVQHLEKMLQANRDMMEKIREDLEEQKSEIDVCLRDLESFVGDYGNGSANIASNVNSLSDGALAVVERVRSDLIDNLQQTQGHVQDESRSLNEQNLQTMKNLSEDTSRLLETMVESCSKTLDTIVNEVNLSTTTTVDTLSSVTKTSLSLQDKAETHRAVQTATLSNMQSETQEFSTRLRCEVASLEDLEMRCLNQEYAVYCPSGTTPARAEYRYPRTLAATSPHERILARFRAMRRYSYDDDCIVVDDEAEARDSESSLSSDSAVFAAPSPPPPPAPAAQPPPIVKCTSETDIYTRRRQQEQGKENVNRSISFKKPSKLPAPSSHKKPLYERNSDR